MTAINTFKKATAKAFNTSILEKKRMAWVDYLRGIAIILVVYRHVLLGLQRANMDIPVSLVYANMIFYSFRMPLFFILSGIFINGSLSRRPVGKLVYTKFENLLYPYFIWSFIQITLQIILNKYSNSDRSLIDYTYILYQPRGLDQFWYLPALFNCSVIYLFLKVKVRLPIWAQLLAGVTFYIAAPYCSAISMFSDWMEFYIFFALGDAVSKIFFEEKSQRLFNSTWTGLIMIPIFAATQLYYLYKAGPTGASIGQLPFLAVALIGCFSMFVLAFRFQKWDILRWLRVLGFHSLYIYVMHVMIAAFTRSVLSRVFGIHNTPILLLVGIAVGVTVPVIIYNTLIKDNIFWFLFSLQKPQKKNKKVPETIAA
jgi:fucose 4-O-acetylase-like acetyltransferase